MRASSRLLISLLASLGPFAGAATPSPAPAPSALTVEVHNAAGAVLASKSDPLKVALTYAAAYQSGDTIAIAAPPGDKYLVVQIDDNVPESMVYSPTARVNFVIPFGNFAIAYNPAAFAGLSHNITVRAATPAEIATYRNVAVDSVDQRNQSQYFPHAIANAVTRNEPRYFERNAIDGNTRDSHHGNWPYESWGNNMDPHPTLKVDFGRDVAIDKVRLYIRSDFAHDRYWTNMTILFSDGTSKDISLQKTPAPQDYDFPTKKVRWIQLQNFKQGVLPPGWAAITEVEVYGKDAVVPQP